MLGDDGRPLSPLAEIVFHLPSLELLREPAEIATRACGGGEKVTQHGDEFEARLEVVEARETQGVRLVVCETSRAGGSGPEAR